MSFYSVFAADYELLFPFRDEVYRFLRSYAGEPGRRVLDLGCGPGHYCGRFASDGYAATGFDLDSTMIAEALKRYPGAEFHCSDIREADAGRGFSCVYSIGNVMAHLGPRDLAGLLGRIGSMVGPGGSWLMQVMNWDALTGMSSFVFPARRIEREGCASIFHRSYRFEEPGSVRFSISLERCGGEQFNEETTLYPVSMERYIRMHESAGFVPVAMFADFAGSPVKGVAGSGLVMAFRKE